MILTFVFNNCNAVTVDVNITKKCIIMNKGRDYVVVYWSKMRPVYCKYKNNTRYYRTLVQYILPLCWFIGKMTKQ